MKAHHRSSRKTQSISILHSPGAAALFLLTGSVTLFVFSSTSRAANFTRNDDTAVRFGVHEISLSGNEGSDNPFDTDCTVTFTPPSGVANEVTVRCFYDGNGTWKARIYVTETGTWYWNSTSSENTDLDGHNGSFSATASNLPGMLRAHETNPHVWMTDRGETFVHIADTAYRLFKMDAISDDYQQYVTEDAGLGINGLRCLLLGEWDWNLYWEGGMSGPKERVSLTNFRHTDERLQWMLDKHPGVYVQLILFPDANMGDDTWSTGHDAQQRERLKRAIIARFAAFPNIFWEVTNDTMVRSEQQDPDNWFLAMDVGPYFHENDPFGHLMAFGHRRDYEYPFCNGDWSTYIIGYTAYDIACDLLDWYSYRQFSKHVYNTEDYYETYHPPAHPRYFYRRLMWSYLLSGASATYAGRWDDIVPYSTSGMVGLDDIEHIRSFLADNHIDLARFEDADVLAEQTNAAGPEYNDGPSRPQCARRGTDEVIVYVPNARAGERTGISTAYGTNEEETRKNADVDTGKTPQLRINLTDFDKGPYSLLWFRPTDGTSSTGDELSEGSWRDLTSPWQGTDVVLLLRTTQAVNESPAVSIENPINGTDFEVGQEIYVNVLASDSDGEVTAVYLLVNGTQDGQIEHIAPYEWQLSGLATGSHSLQARAVDDDGDETLSEIISIQVGDGSVTPDGGSSADGSPTDDGGADAGPGNQDAGHEANDDNVTGGCNCRSAASEIPSTVWIVFLLVTLLTTKRRRTQP